MSERKACLAVGLPRATQRHKSSQKDESALRKQIIDIAQDRKRFGYERITWLLQRDGLRINKKRVYRIYKQEGLQVRKRCRKRERRMRKPLEPATYPCQRWSLDFVSDSLSTGRRFRTLNVKHSLGAVINTTPKRVSWSVFQSTSRSDETYRSLSAAPLQLRTL